MGHSRQRRSASGHKDPILIEQLGTVPHGPREGLALWRTIEPPRPTGGVETVVRLSKNGKARLRKVVMDTHARRDTFRPTEEYPPNSYSFQETPRSLSSDEGH